MNQISVGITTNTCKETAAVIQCAKALRRRETIWRDQQTGTTLAQRVHGWHGRYRRLSQQQRRAKKVYTREEMLGLPPTAEQVAAREKAKRLLKLKEAWRKVNQ